MDYPDPKVLAGLQRPQAYPDDPGAGEGIEWIQTHLSHVFLTRDRVYKFRKPVTLGFVDFATLDERNADCLREVGLNRRLAPDVYRGVAALRIEGGRVHVGEATEELASEPGVEHCVVMRRLPDGGDALSRLQRGELGSPHIDRLARVVADFHGRVGLGAPAPFDEKTWHARCTAPFADSLALLDQAPGAPPERVARVRDRALRFAEERRDVFESRRLAGRAVDAHGDLHLQHVWFEADDADPIVIDCLEFDEGLRRIDAAAEVAFTAMDLRYRRRADLAERFLRRYAAERDDFDLYRPLGFFEAYRASVRAKVAGIAAADAGIAEEQRAAATQSVRRHLELADALLASRDPGALVLVGGVVGTGKSTLATVLAEALDARGGAAVVSSDRVRKQQAGLSPQRPASDAERARLYTDEAKARTYRALLERARPVVGSGRVAILDATWSRADDRARAVAVARELGARAVFVEARCAADEAVDRLARRRARGGDPSDAGPELYAQSADAFEPVRSEEGLDCTAMGTDAPDWRERAAALAAGYSGLGFS
ncbi:MAG: AAA family ATPase [Myxococcota bacterium]